MFASQHIENCTHRFVKWAGTTAGFSVGFISIIIWFIVGKFYHFSTEWENALTIYIGVITFLMIFLMQRAQNKELLALHIKLNELISATKDADNHLINSEELTEDEILEIRQNHSEIEENK